MDIQSAIIDIIKFMRNSGYKIDPIPRVFLDDTENKKDDPFIQTGNYNFKEKKITLFVNGRHLKDILRSFCHEMIHHNQGIENPESQVGDLTGNLEDNENLLKIESDAFTRGNVVFRMWTERSRPHQ